MASATTTRTTQPTPQPGVADLLHDIGRDMRTIAVDELELGRRKLTDFMEQLVLKAAIAILGAVVALIGLGMLCMVAVAALAPVIPALWLRLLIMAVAYLAVGGGAAYIFAKRAAATRPDLDKQVAEIGETLEAVEHGLEH